MPGPYVAPVAGDETLPKRVDVVVIGGGIVGSSTALELAERGHSVAICEKGGISCEQSSRNWGWVRLSRRDVREMPLMLEARKIWSGLAERTGHEVGYRQTGIVFTAASDRVQAQNARYRDQLQDFQVPSNILSAKEVSDKYPELDLPLYGALLTPDDGRAEPQLAGPAIALAARDRGATIHLECAVRGLELSAGRVSGVVTERGTIACDSVVLAGGVWSNFFARRYGIDIPQLNVTASVLRTDPLEGGPEEPIWCEEFALRKRLDGGYTIASGHENVVDIVPRSFRYMFQYLPALRSDWKSLNFRISGQFFKDMFDAQLRPLDEASAFEYTRVIDPVPSKRMTDGALRALAKRWPVFTRATIAQRWGGLIDVTPDAIPVIDEAAMVPGFFIATGFSGHGFGIAPAAGRLMADLVTGTTPIVDPTAFKLSRFSDGTRIILSPEQP
ncbi:FAD-binding oxidoreductase [Mesorhizobium sp. B2-5-13]|uniref:NAD(P)/FAD-dependent oxidoreductase n=1 Tax=unclassified Mesorhizobium TaxID=325217 RepID=UPI00112E8BDD|nr:MULTISPECIES: FAD-binding oxidoreductase [unclassified Mesorhizobium]TPJ81918.1 FAD-binding oxidoreductase [Mesorhizobium sp. B2-5-13]TPK45855.1 FAD-binding oxidoreductase [Mesorhizobium sp. B2-5-5]